MTAPLLEWKQNANVVVPGCLAPRIAWEIEGYSVFIGFVGANAPDLDSLNLDCLPLVIVKNPALANAVF